MLDRHDATSRLLESDPHLQQQTTHKSPHTVEEHVRHDDKRAFDGYDDNGVRALQHDNVSSPSAVEPECSDNSANVQWKGLSMYLITWELLSLALCGAFLALGACVASLEGQPQTKWSNQVIQATRIAPSIWPIVFSGILANAVRAFANWRVERGISLLALEQLLGSLTMASSIITMFRWSIFHISSVALILLWAFNPLGSQASFRVAYLQAGTGMAEGQITTFSANVTVQILLSGFEDPVRTITIPIIRSFYTASLYDYASNTQYVDPTNSTTQRIVTLLGGPSSAAIQTASDLWGNVRIPSLEYHLEYDDAEPTRWLVTPWDKQIQNYSSLVGERISGVNPGFIGNTTFTVSSSYQRFKCSPWLYLNTSQPFLEIDGTSRPENTSEADAWLLKHSGANYWDNIQFRSGPSSNYRTFFTTLMPPESPGSSQPSDIIFASSNQSEQLSVTRCSARTMYVDAQVVCMSRGSVGKPLCGVGAVRATPNPPDEETANPVQANPHGKNSLLYFMDMLDDAKSADKIVTYRNMFTASSSTEYYLQNPLAFPPTFPRNNQFAELGKLDIRTFERRFSLLWNTLWKVSWARESVMGGNFTTALVSDAPGEGYAVTRPTEIVQRTTSNVTFPLEPVYVIDRPWLTLYFVSVGVMLLAAVSSLVIHTQRRAPTILGHVSSLIRDSPYFKGNGAYYNSAEDGADKTKRLAGLKVMVADVGSTRDKTGKIAFAPADRGERVEKGKWYE
ncbi:hypothetical protein BKA63DRAFT_560721 [Paraphoma chrysanthemicola]|nr:hypothetical protein BKA63DRAFT_560721 [Paraphoma chrysanthemicola]